MACVSDRDAPDVKMISQKPISLGDHDGTNGETRSEQQHGKLFEHYPDMMFVTDRQGCLLDVNPAGMRIFGCKSKQEMLLHGSLFEMCAASEEGNALRRELLESGCVRDFEIEMQRKGGDGFTACITAFASTDGNGSVQFEGTLRDVTERRRGQREVAESARHIRMLNEHILNMLMVMSHDIRGPLVAMAAILKLLLRGTYGGMDESVANTLKDLSSRVINLLGIAEDYLGKAYSVNGSLVMQREILDLRQDIIDPVLDELYNEIEKQSIMIDNRLGAIPAGVIHISAHKVWLKSVFRNLFKNAVKYGGRGCTIAFGFEDHMSYYRFNVYNSGKPVPEEEREKLFTKFGRIEGNGADKVDGVGLGLYLIKEIIEKHGGDIWYSPKQDGSDFVFTLPKDDHGA